MVREGATTHPQVAEIARVILWLLIGEGWHGRQLILEAATVSVVKRMLALLNFKKHDGTWKHRVRKLSVVLNLQQIYRNIEITEIY